MIKLTKLKIRKQKKMNFYKNTYNQIVIQKNKNKILMNRKIKNQAYKILISCSKSKYFIKK